MIAFFGASVTQQRDGYAYKIIDKLNEKVNVYGFGGMHLNNAGISFIDKVIKDNPKLCFIDWFSSEYIVQSDKTKEYIDTIVYKFSKINCKVIFLFLPHKQLKQRLDFNLFCKNHLDKMEISYIDINDKIKNLKSILRDDVHTTDYGSELYADTIYEMYANKYQSISIPVKLPEETKYSNIENIEIGKRIDTIFNINGNGEIIGFLLTIGPHSGIIEINGSGIFMKENTWDRWCNYTRRHFNLSFSINGDTTLKILQDKFDEKGNIFNKRKKYLVIHKIYYIGEVNIDRNIYKKIPNGVFKFQNIQGRIIQKFISLLKLK